MSSTLLLKNYKTLFRFRNCSLFLLRLLLFFFDRFVCLALKWWFERQWFKIQNLMLSRFSSFAKFEVQSSSTCVENKFLTCNYFEFLYNFDFEEANAILVILISIKEIDFHERFCEIEFKIANIFSMSNFSIHSNQKTIKL